MKASLEKIVFVSFLLFLIVLVGIFGQQKRIGLGLEAETFDATTPLTTTKANPYDNNTVLLNKSMSYFIFVCTYFMSDSPNNVIPSTCNVSLTPPCLALKIFNFLPTFLDSLCNLETDTNQKYCTSFFIDNNTTTDLEYYDSHLVCQSLNGTIGQTKNQSQVRILNNNYSFVKRCINLIISKITAVSGSQGTAQFTVVCNGYGSAFFALLRPCLITFPGVGTYYVNLYKQGTPVATVPPTGTVPASDFRSFSDLAKNAPYVSDTSATTTSANDVIFYLSPVVGSSAQPISPSSDSNKALTSVVGTTFPTIYYFDYQNPADFFKTTTSTSTTASPPPAVVQTTFNTLTLVFDQDYMANNPTGLTVPLSATSTTVNVCTSLIFTWTNNLFQVQGVGSMNAGQNFTYSAHPDFVTKATQSTSAVYHVVVTYTLDLITIATFFKDLTLPSSVKNSFYTMKQIAATNSGSTPTYIQYPIVNNSWTNTRYPYDNLTGNASICPQTSIPNLAKLAKKMGYTFSK